MNLNKRGVEQRRLFSVEADPGKFYIHYTYNYVMQQILIFLYLLIGALLCIPLLSALYELM